MSPPTSERLALELVQQLRAGSISFEEFRRSVDGIAEESGKMVQIARAIISPHGFPAIQRWLIDTVVEHMSQPTIHDKIIA